MNTIVILFILVPILAIVLLLLNVLLAPHNPDESKVSAYECGFSVIHGQTRSNFQIHFYLVAILFLVFDLEIVLILPLAVTLYHVSLFGLSIALLFFAILTVGFVLEIGSGAIKISSNSVQSPSNKVSNSTPVNITTPILTSPFLLNKKLRLRTRTVLNNNVLGVNNLNKRLFHSLIKNSSAQKDLNKKWLKYVIFTILFILIIVNYCLYDLHFTYYISCIYLFLFSNLYWIKFVILWWIVIFIMFYILILFKYLFLFDAKIIYQTKVLPRFILNRFTDLNNQSSKPELQDILIKIYFRIVLFHLLVGFLYTLLLIYS